MIMIVTITQWSYFGRKSQPFAGFGTILLCLIAGALSSFAQSQPELSVLRGVVLDPNRAAIVGARIVVLGKKGTAAVTNDQGQFSAMLPAGEYRLKVEAEGFASVTQSVAVGKRPAELLEIALPLAESTATVTISGTDALGYRTDALSTATRTLTNLRDVPQSIAIVSHEQITDQSMKSVADIVTYVPGISSHQGENNRDQLVIRGVASSADFFLNGVRDDVQYYRDLYNLDRVEILKGPNAMIFGRGGGGGIVNRATKQAGFSKLREFTFAGGSFHSKRFAADYDQPLSQKAAVRLNGMFENSGSFRRFVNLERYGLNPSLTFTPNAETRIAIDFEHFHDRRVADRGIPSFKGKPADISIETYFGNPEDSYVRARVDRFSAMLQHQIGRWMITNRTVLGYYDRGYQNFVPGTVNAAKTLVTLSAYNNATKRRNLFSQTNLAYSLSTGKVKHTLLIGSELGSQATDNFRNSGFFNNVATSIQIPYDNPLIASSVTFRQSATDANNYVKTNLAAAFVQDQIELSRRVQLIAGLRFDYFDLKFHNNRTGEDLRRIDRLVSPRTGIVVKPVMPLSLYASYSVSYLPGSGDQFSSLTTITQQVKPEQFTNYEVGAKWDVRRNLTLTAAAYRQDRTNTRSSDPNDPTRILQTGSQRTNGFEVGVNGSVTRSWTIAGGYAHQNAFISSATTAARTGAQVALVPHNTFSIWNKYQVTKKFGLGVGIINRSDMFAAIDDAVTLPGYTRVDAAIYLPFAEKWKLQANIENLLNKKYFLNADGNNNISPGSPRALRLSLITRF